MIRLAASLLLLATAVAGCVSAYDPAAPSRFSFSSRADDLGTSHERPAAKSPRAARREMAAAVNTPPAAPNPPRTESPKATVTSVRAAARAAFPQTPAGGQLRWFVDVLAGAAMRDLEVRFAPAFLEKVPATRLRDIARQWRRDQFADGPVELARIEPGDTPSSLTAVVRGTSTGAHTQVRLGVNEAGQITMLSLGPITDLGSAVTTWSRLDERLRALPGSVSVAAAELTESGLREVHGFGADHRLAIGSTFKLYILGALAEEIAAGRLAWDTPLLISDDLKSLPSGQMQLETEGNEFPISRYAELMISISDNTAADHLLHKIGRGTVEAYMARLNGDPARTRPFLSTMEMFRLKLGPDRTLPGRYAAADEAGRRAMLAKGGEVEQTSPSLAAASMWTSPYEIERLEWFASATELCRLMADLHRLEMLPGMEPLRSLLRVNPGLQFDSQRWKSIAYKGGSEPGVLNMTWLLERDDGRWFAVSVGWNDTEKDVDIRKMAELAAAAVALVGGAE